MVWKAATVAFLAGLSTYWSYKFDVLVNLNGINLVTVAVVFPLVFAVNAAYQRRQHALRSLDILKGLSHCVSALHYGLKQTDHHAIF